MAMRPELWGPKGSYGHGPMDSLASAELPGRGGQTEGKEEGHAQMAVSVVGVCVCLARIILSARLVYT
jgi:hypothetical protein